jgi:hypothetical protein
MKTFKHIGPGMPYGKMIERGHEFLGQLIKKIEVGKLMYNAIESMAQWRCTNLRY